MVNEHDVVLPILFSDASAMLGFSVGPPFSQGRVNLCSNLVAEYLVVVFQCRFYQQGFEILVESSQESLGLLKIFR